MKRILQIVIGICVCVSVMDKSFAQIRYSTCLSTGYYFDIAGSQPIQSLKSINQDTNGVYHTTIGADYWRQISFSIDSSNHFANLKFGFPRGNDSAGSFMTKDNPGGFSFYPGGTTGFTSDVYNNTYDSVHRAFYMHYGFSETGSTNEDSFTTQVYEKIVPYPSVSSFNPLMGEAGTKVTIKGWGFLNVNYVTFNGVASNFTVLSDSEIAAMAPAGGGAGIIRVSILPNTDPYILNTGSTGNCYIPTPFTYQSSDHNFPAPRSLSGLYSQGDTTVCIPWIKDSANWTSYLTTDSSGTHIEMQTLFQDEPGNLCGFQSYFADTAIERVNYWWTGFDPLSWFTNHIYKQGIDYFTRNYRINFSDTVFSHPVGVRLFFTTAEVNQFFNRKAKRGEGFSGVNDFYIIRYDGPNEDFDLYNNADDSTDYKMIKPAFFYYGPNNEYCYFEFYTDRFSEFQIATGFGAGLLPLKILNFSAIAQNHSSIVIWQTSNEINTSYFSVQRSTDGIHFTNIGKVNATNTSGNHNYSYRDDLASLAGTKVYYRLQMVDKDGSSKESSIVSVSLSNDQKITIVPNPAHSYFMVSGNLAAKNTMLITDMSGKVVLVKNNITSNEKININALTKGIYLVKMDDSKTITVKKLIVE